MNYIDGKQQNVNRVLMDFRTDFERAYIEQIPNKYRTCTELGTDNVRQLFDYYYVIIDFLSDFCPFSCNFACKL